VIDDHQRILANVSRDEFVGRDAELREIARHASQLADRRGLILLAPPEWAEGNYFARHTISCSCAAVILFRFTLHSSEVKKHRSMLPGDSFKIFCNSTSLIDESILHCATPR